MEAWTKTCGLPLLFNFEPQPHTSSIRRFGHETLRKVLPRSGLGLEVFAAPPAKIGGRVRPPKAKKAKDEQRAPAKTGARKTPLTVEGRKIELSV